MATDAMEPSSMVRVNVVTVRLPDAALIADGRKAFAVCGSSTDYRGPLVLTAARHGVFQGVGRSFSEPALAQYADIAGKAIAVVDLVDVEEAGIRPTCYRKVPRMHYKWSFKNVRRIAEPFEVFGGMGIFPREIPAEVAERLNATAPMPVARHPEPRAPRRRARSLKYFEKAEMLADIRRCVNAADALRLAPAGSEPWKILAAVDEVREKYGLPDPFEVS